MEEKYLIDASLLAKLRELGFLFTATNLSFEIIYKTATHIRKPIDGTYSFPAYQDADGNQYIADENYTVYLIRAAGDGPIINNPPVNTPTTDTSGNNTPPPPGQNIGSGKIYSSFAKDDIISNQQEVVTRALWTNNIGNLTTFYTSSEQTAKQKSYYYEIFNKNNNDDCQSEPQFSVVYGNVHGSGSIDEGVEIEDTPSRAIYNQYRLLCLDPDKKYFTINGVANEHIYAINVNRLRMREFLDEGNIEVNLAHLSGSQYIAGGGNPDTYTGSAVTLSGDGKLIRLIDDSKINSAEIMRSGEVYKMVSGSLEDGIYNPENPVIYGQLFRRLGIIVIDADMLDASGSFGTVKGREVAGDNAFKLFKSISGSALYTDGSGDPLGFQGRGGEIVKSTHYFVRIKNAEYNFSNNPSFVTGSEGNLLHASMIDDPKTYVTSIGLYNNAKDLIAIAKLSKAIQKSFTNEALIKVKLDF